MKTYDVIFENEEGIVETIKENVSLTTAKKYKANFEKNLPFHIVHVPYHLYIVPSSVENTTLTSVDKNFNVDNLPTLTFKMSATKDPKNSDKWFDSFEEGKTFTAYNIPEAQLKLDELCEKAGTKDDPNWKKFGPSAILYMGKEIIDF